LPTDEEVSQWEDHKGPWGLPCGEFNELVVLDFDGEDGMALYHIMAGTDDLPDTWTARTASGGLHLYYRCPEEPPKNAVRVKPGLDIRSEGGYVVVPSDFPDGREWIVPPYGSPTDLPGWVLDLRRGESQRLASGVPEDDGLPPGVKEGTRNDTAAHHIGRWFGKGLRHGEVCALALSWNRKNKPPLPEDEIRKIVRSIEKAESEKRPKLVVLTGEEAIRQKPEKKPFLIEGVAYDPSKIILAGFAGSGKSLLALNLAACMSEGNPFLGHKTCQKTVLYLDAENPSAEVDERLVRVFGSLEGDLKLLRILRDFGGINVATREGREAVTELILEQEAGLLVLDSYLKFFHVKDENASTDVRRAFDSVDQIVADTRCSVLIIDHTAKPSLASHHGSGGSGKLTPRGSGAKMDFCDVAMALEKKGNDAGRDLRVLTFPKLRGFRDRSSILLELGEDDLVYRTKEETGLLPPKRIADFVEQCGVDGVTFSAAVKALSEEIGHVVDPRTVQRAINRAAYEKAITKVGNKRGARLYPVGDGSFRK
jgi:hypothetical protein